MPGYCIWTCNKNLGSTASYKPGGQELKRNGLTLGQNMEEFSASLGFALRNITIYGKGIKACRSAMRPDLLNSQETGFSSVPPLDPGLKAFSLPA